MRKTIIAIFLSVAVLEAFAQKYDAAFFDANPDCCGGIYYTYRYDRVDYTPVPDGYETVYVSMYARHGSRWHRSDMCYTVSRHYLNLALEMDMLTDLGRSIQLKADRAAASSVGNLGTLTPQGREEHRGIAERMYDREKKLFSRSHGNVMSLSTQIPRCIMSMVAFTDRLEEKNPDLAIDKFTNEAIGAFMVPSVGRKYGMARAAEVASSAIDSMALICSRTVLPRLLKPGFREKLGMDPKSCTRLTRALFYLSMVMQDSEGDARIHEAFTPEERYSMWTVVNRNRYATFGPSIEFGDGIMLDGTVLLEHVVADADDALSSGGRIAFLRFGHDATIFSALAAMNAGNGGARVSVNDPDLGSRWADFTVSPMASNLQWVFYRNRRSGDVIVKLLHNERECTIPVESDIAPYYRWDDLKRYYVERISTIRSWDSVRRILSSKVSLEGDIDR